MYELQNIKLIKEISTQSWKKGGSDDPAVQTINELLSKGWVILNTYKLTQVEKPYTDCKMTLEVLWYVLGFPRYGIDPIADENYSEFFPKE